MKRSPLKRDSPLAALRRGAALASNPDKTREWQQRSRKRLPEASPKAKAARADHAVIRRQVFARDRYCLMLDVVPGHRCGGAPLTPHHLLKASAGGTYSLENLVVVCSAGNTWIEDNPNEAHGYGFVARRGETKTFERLMERVAALREPRAF